jgi:hypothetical protein
VNKIRAPLLQPGLLRIPATRPLPARRPRMVSSGAATADIAVTAVDKGNTASSGHADMIPIPAAAGRHSTTVRARLAQSIHDIAAPPMLLLWAYLAYWTAVIVSYWEKMAGRAWVTAVIIAAIVGLGINAGAIGNTPLCKYLRDGAYVCVVTAVYRVTSTNALRNRHGKSAMACFAFCRTDLPLVLQGPSAVLASLPFLFACPHYHPSRRATRVTSNISFPPTWAGWAWHWDVQLVGRCCCTSCIEPWLRASAAAEHQLWPRLITTFLAPPLTEGWSHTSSLPV